MKQRHLQSENKNIPGCYSTLSGLSSSICLKIAVQDCYTLSSPLCGLLWAFLHLFGVQFVLPPFSGKKSTQTVYGLDAVIVALILLWCPSLFSENQIFDCQLLFSYLTPCLYAIIFLPQYTEIQYKSLFPFIRAFLNQRIFLI